jgi:hypothetical protein
MDRQLSEARSAAILALYVGVIAPKVVGLVALALGG